MSDKCPVYETTHSPYSCEQAERRIADLELQLEACILSRDMKSAHISKLEKQIAEIVASDTRQMEADADRIDKLKAENAYIRNELEIAHHHNAESLNKIDRLKDENDYLKSEIQLITAPLESVGHVIRELKDQLAAKDAEIADLERQLDYYKSIVTSDQKYQEGQMAEHIHVTKTANEKIAELERQLDQWKRRYYETQEYWCGCNLPEHICELHQKFGEDKEVIGLAQEIDALKAEKDTLIDQITIHEMEIQQLKTEITDLHSLFDLRWAAGQRAIKAWQAANPGNELTWPDHADLCVWLMEQLSVGDKEIERLKRERLTDQYIDQMDRYLSHDEKLEEIRKLREGLRTAQNLISDASIGMHLVSYDQTLEQACLDWLSDNGKLIGEGKK